MLSDNSLTSFPSCSTSFISYTHFLTIINYILWLIHVLNFKSPSLYIKYMLELYIYWVCTLNTYFFLHFFFSPTVCCMHIAYLTRQLPKLISTIEHVAPALRQWEWNRLGWCLEMFPNFTIAELSILGSCWMPSLVMENLGSLETAIPVFVWWVKPVLCLLGLRAVVICFTFPPTVWFAVSASCFFSVG
jgi:hypothetical protein